MYKEARELFKNPEVQDPASIDVSIVELVSLIGHQQYWKICFVLVNLWLQILLCVAITGKYE